MVEEAPKVDHNWPGNSDDHVWGKWYPLNNREIRRQCVHPKCNAIEVKVARA